MATTGARPRVSRLVAALALGWCGFVLLANIAGGAVSCAGDTSDCASVAGGGVPWDHARDLTSSPQYMSIIVLGLITMGVLILGIGFGRAYLGRVLRSIGLALTVASTALPLALWWGQL